MTRMTLGDAALLALALFVVLVAISAVMDGVVKLARIRADSRLRHDKLLRYCRDDLETAVETAIHRTGFAAGREGDPLLSEEIKAVVRDGVLEDIDAGNIARAASGAAR